mmetsp:Transcript_3021/g.5789  ORF Transcript_3021/g.5789 Transcript_3021/m.5789 type:complete len:310 (-) Transcript_3021:57-986(-)
MAFFPPFGQPQHWGAKSPQSCGKIDAGLLLWAPLLIPRLRGGSNKPNQPKASSGNPIKPKAVVSTTSGDSRLFPRSNASLTGLPSTNPLYMDDTYRNKAEAKVIQIVSGEQESIVITDQTIFHPQGGGQPSDEGTMTVGSNNFEVKKVTKAKETGAILHAGVFRRGSFREGDVVSQEVNMTKRIFHARIHSAGHLLDVAMAKIGEQRKPGKGYHYPQGAYVEYIGKIDVKERDAIVTKLQAAIDELIKSDIATKVELKNNIRHVSVAGVEEGCPCGGTHVRSTGEIKSMRVTKLKNNKKNARVSYSVEV